MNVKVFWTKIDVMESFTDSLYAGIGSQWRSRGQNKGYEQS
jgi:hypothetical protein